MVPGLPLVGKPVPVLVQELVGFPVQGPPAVPALFQAGAPLLSEVPAPVRWWVPAPTPARALPGVWAQEGVRVQTPVPVEIGVPALAGVPVLVSAQAQYDLEATNTETTDNQHETVSVTIPVRDRNLLREIVHRFGWACML